MSLKPNCGCTAHADSWTPSIFHAGAAAIVTTSNRAFIKDRCHGSGLGPHQWHADLQWRFVLHPVVSAMLVHRPKDWQHLLLEWPHISEKDSTQIAYTRDEAKGWEDKQLVGPIGRYVARHWPHVADHVRRDACALFTPDTMEFLPGTIDQMIRSVQEGPKSCMQNSFYVHPYNVYDPKYGWAAAVRLNGDGRIDGRALTWTNPDNADDKCFVRTYVRCKNDPNDGYSHADQILAAWLESQGFTHRKGWPYGAQLAHIEYQGIVVLPYIDGDNDWVYTSHAGGETHLRICDEDDAEYKGENQSGYAESVDNDDDIGSCECCGNTVREGEDYFHAGRHEDYLIGECCADEYTRVTAQTSFGSIHTYHVHDDNVLTVNGEAYDEDNLPDYIVQLEDGDYIDTNTDDYCVIDDEYYLCDDRRVVYCEDSEYRLRDDCWECAHSGEWYSEDDTDDQVEVDGETYHRDSLSEITASKQVAPLFPELATA